MTIDWTENTLIYQYPIHKLKKLLKMTLKYKLLIIDVKLNINIYELYVYKEH